MAGCTCSSLWRETVGRAVVWHQARDRKQQVAMAQQSVCTYSQTPAETVEPLEPQQSPLIPTIIPLSQPARTLMAPRPQTSRRPLIWRGSVRMPRPPSSSPSRRHGSLSFLPPLILVDSDGYECLCRRVIAVGFSFFLALLHEHNSQSSRHFEGLF